jgi:tetratricopeptide (TPR) repeat protein
MDRQHIASEGDGRLRRLSPVSSALRPAGEPRRSFFTSGKSLLPLNLGQPTSRNSGGDDVNAAQTSSEPGGRQLVAKAIHLSDKGMQELGENSTKTSRQQTYTNKSPDIDSAPEDPTYASENPEVRERHPQSARMRKRLRLEIEAYLRETYLNSVYGDSLSSSRTRLYEPSWPPSVQPDNSSQTPHLPKSRNGADTVLQEIIAPLLDWYSLPDSQANTREALQKQDKIAKALDKHERERGARICRRKLQGSGVGTLYRNLPDAGLEANILMLTNRTHLAAQRGYIERAERLIDRALGLVDALDYRPLNAKCWYWKGLVADQRGSAKEAAEAFFNALECVGKYIEGDYLPVYIQVYEQTILDMLHVEDEASRIEMARRLQRAAKGAEPLHLPSPKPARYEWTGLDLTPLKGSSPSVTERSGTGEGVVGGGPDSLTSSEEIIRPELLGLNINISLPSPSDLSRIRRRSTNTPLSPHPTSPLKPLPAPRLYLP